MDEGRRRGLVRPSQFPLHLPCSECPEDPEPFEAIMQDVNEKILPGITHWQSPRFFAYYPANASFPAQLGEMISAALNVIGFSWVSSPACTELETQVLDWLAKLLGLPDCFHSTSGKGGGVIQGTASEAVLVAMLAAKARKLGPPPVNRNSGVFGKIHASLHRTQERFVAYSSDQAHSCVKKVGRGGRASLLCPGALTHAPCFGP